MAKARVPTRLAFWLALADILLLLLAFLGVHGLNYGNLQISATNWQVLLLQLSALLAVSLLVGKYRRLPRLSLIWGWGLLLKTGVVLLFVLPLLILGLQFFHFSRTMVYVVVIGLLLLELVALFLYQWAAGPVHHTLRPDTGAPAAGISRSLLLLDALLLLLAFLLVTYLKRGLWLPADPYRDILLLLLGLWLAASLLSGKFAKHNFHDFYTSLGPALKSAAMMAGGLALLIYFFRIEPVSRLQTMGPVALLLLLEVPLFYLYASYRRHDPRHGDIETVAEVKARLRAEEELPPAPAAEVQKPVVNRLRHALEFFDHRIFTFIEQHVPLEQIDRADCTLISTDNLFNLDILPPQRAGLVVNLHKVNDVRWINQYFLLVHGKLRAGGYLVGKVHTNLSRREFIYARYPKYLNTMLYLLDFTWHRVFPKLPWLQKFYFALTRGRERMVSRAEVLGRLCFCGYEIVAETELDYRLFFIARKVKLPSRDENPTFGPLVRLNRTGVGGQPIVVYKFRTMHPFSEYLQEYVYRLCSLREGGKFKDDFRVTEWGGFMRRAWLDELPMLWNWLRGDLQLVGVRPLSRQYLELYSPSLRELRQQVKPGLLPPFYADMPTTLEEIQDSEWRYLQAYLANPWRTQARYFFKCFYNIVVKRKRSA